VGRAHQNGARFKDFLQPATILAALPLSIGGAFVALLVTKNSILLVEYAIVARRQGMSRFEALVDACGLLRRRGLVRAGHCLAPRDRGTLGKRGPAARRRLR
jgi:multidrug efflux pump subunit AcrB